MICETPEDLAEHVYQHLPLRLRVVGRQRCRDIVDTAIREWPVRALSTLANEAQSTDVFDTLEEQVKSSYTERYGDDDKYGFVILSIILVAAISAIVQVLVKWWLEKKLNKELMESWHGQYVAADRVDERDRGAPGSGGEAREQRSGDE